MDQLLKPEAEELVDHGAILPLQSRSNCMTHFGVGSKAHDHLDSSVIATMLPYRSLT